MGFAQAVAGQAGRPAVAVEKEDEDSSGMAAVVQKGQRATCAPGGSPTGDAAKVDVAKEGSACSEEE
jgi:hypothetical protein